MTLRRQSAAEGLGCVAGIPLDAVRRLSGLNDIRNDFSHYEAMTELEAAKVCQELREQIADAVLTFEWLGRRKEKKEVAARIDSSCVLFLLRSLFFDQNCGLT